MLPAAIAESGPSHRDGAGDPRCWGESALRTSRSVHLAREPVSSPRRPDDEVKMTGRLLASISAVLACSAATASVSAAHPSSGGASYGGRPSVSKLECIDGQTGRCAQGAILRVRGEGLAQAITVTFLGGRGSRDDVNARTDKRSPHRVLVRVPARAASGPVRVRSRSASVSTASKRLQVTPAPVTAPAVPAGEGVFPIRGEHDFGTEINRFGGGREHQGQDVFAKCGTPLVAARSGTVTAVKFQERAGNYVVITADDGTSQAYMHMLEPGTVEQRSRVAAGQPIGQVGQTGRASGCHLHFELWTAPGWYQGGRPIDPLPELQAYAARG